MFQTVPDDVSNSDVAKSMTQELDRLRTTLHYLMKKKQNNNPEESNKKKRFAKEIVRKGTKVFKMLNISYLLLVSIFGSNNCSLNEYEIVHRTKKVMVVHLTSRKRVRDLFELKGIHLLQLHDDDGNLIVAASKVIVQDEYGRDGIGMVSDKEDNNKLVVILESGKEIIVLKPDYQEEGLYYYHDDGNKYKIIEYDPVRIRVSATGSFQIMFNRFILNDKNKKIVLI